MCAATRNERGACVLWFRGGQFKDSAKMQRNAYSYLSPKCTVVNAPEKGGHAVQAIEPIAMGEVLTVWGGRVVNAEQAADLGPGFREHNIQIEEGMYLAPLVVDDESDYVNHSCDPNTGLAGQIVLVAMRDIAAGEEITFDYAMADGDGYDQFPCACGAASCRGEVSSNDWKQPALWERYKGYFSPYLQRRIDRLKQVGGINS